MALINSPYFYVLIGANICIYIIFIFGYLRSKKTYKLPLDQNVTEVFNFLEKSFKKTFPEVREGFTWSEAIARAKQIPLDISWEKVDQELMAYESFRYGANPRRTFETYEVLKLAYLLRDGIKMKVKKNKHRRGKKFKMESPDIEIKSAITTSDNLAGSNQKT